MKVLKDKFDSEGFSESPPVHPFFGNFESLGERKKFGVSLDFFDFSRSVSSSGGKFSKISFRW